MQFPVTIATVPFRIPNSPQQPTIHYGNCVAKQFQSDLKSPLQLMPISSCVRNGFYQFSDYFREIDGAPAISRPFAAIKVTARSLMHRRLTVDRNNATRFLFFLLLLLLLPLHGGAALGCDEEPACEHVEGGRYVGPEFQLGQVYDGGLAGDTTDVVLYRPVYVCVSSLRTQHVHSFATKSSAANHHKTNANATVQLFAQPGSSATPSPPVTDQSNPSDRKVQS